MSRAIRPGDAPGETVLRLSWLDAAATVSYGLTSFTFFNGLLQPRLPTALRIGAGLFLVALAACFVLVLRFQVRLRPDSISIRRYGREWLLPIESITHVRVAWTNSRGAPVILTVNGSETVKLPVPTRTIFGLKRSRLAQVDVVREWWSQEKARRAIGLPPSGSPSRAARLTNPYQAPTV